MVRKSDIYSQGEIDMECARCEAAVPESVISNRLDQVVGGIGPVVDDPTFAPMYMYNDDPLLYAAPPIWSFLIPNLSDV